MAGVSPLGTCRFRGEAGMSESPIPGALREKGGLESKLMDIKERDKNKDLI